MNKLHTQIVTLIFLFSINIETPLFSQTRTIPINSGSSNKKKDDSQLIKTINKINIIYREYMLSEGSSKFGNFKLKGQFIIRDQHKIDLNKVEIYASSVGLVFRCKDGSDCIIESSQNKNEPQSYTRLVCYPISDRNVIDKLITEFTRIKFLLNI